MRWEKTIFPLTHLSLPNNASTRLLSSVSSFSPHRRELQERPEELLGATGANHSKGDLMEDGHPREADEIELIPNLAFQQDRESGTPELAPDRVPPDASTSRSLPRWSCHWRWEQKQRRTAGRQRESVDGEASQNLTHRNSTMRDAAAPMTLSMAAELRPSGPPRAVSKLRHAHGGGGRAQTAWLPCGTYRWAKGQKLSFPSTLNSTWMGIWTE